MPDLDRFAAHAAMERGGVTPVRKHREIVRICVPALIAVARASKLALSASMRHGPMSPEAIRTAQSLEDAHAALDAKLAEAMDNA
jgi:hypothetical protein